MAQVVEAAEESRSLALMPGSALPADPGLVTDAEAERVREALASSRAGNTAYRYSLAWLAWRRWCEQRGCAALPAVPALLAVYLTERAAGGLGAAGLRLAAAAINDRHRDGGYELPGHNPGVRRTLLGLTRKAARPLKAATGLDGAGLAALRAVALQPRVGRRGVLESVEYARKRGLMDRALAGVMWCCLLRRSEAAALRWTDLSFEGDGSARLLVRYSKTDQMGEGKLLYVNRQVAGDLAAWREIQGDTLGERVFPLQPAQLAVRLRAAAAAAGLDGRFSGHSPRIGMAQDLAGRGVELPALMEAGRWSSPRMPAYYIRGQTAARGAVARCYP